MVDTNSPTDHQSNQSVTRPPIQPVNKPSIPASPDQSLSSDLSKGLNSNNAIPSKSDRSLSSTRIMNEQATKITGRR